MVVGFLNSFLKCQLTFFSTRWRLSAGRTRPTKAMVNNSELSQIKKNMNKATIFRVMEIKRGNYSKPLENMDIKLMHYITV